MYSCNQLPRDKLFSKCTSIQLPAHLHILAEQGSRYKYRPLLSLSTEDMVRTTCPLVLIIPRNDFNLFRPICMEGGEGKFLFKYICMLAASCHPPRALRERTINSSAVRIAKKMYESLGLFFINGSLYYYSISMTEQI